MNAENTNTTGGGLAGINSNRLFLASCLSLISTSVAFGAITSMMGDFKDVFALTNAQAGLIGGATIWGFTITIFVFGPLVDVLGMKNLMRFSMLCHLVGPLVMIFASGFNMLFAGGLIIAFANGTVEAVCNPLVATIYPNDKTKKLNHFHVWFPGGIVIGGLLAFFIDKMGAEFWDGMPLAAWQAKIALVLVPTVIYGILFTGQVFPATERVQSGLSFGDMVKATLLRPLYIILFICMGLTASLELAPGRWMGEIMGGIMGNIEALTKIVGDNAGILVLVYGSTLMAILRMSAGPVVKRFSPTGLLLFSAIFGGVGLFSLTYFETPLMLFISATVFYIGVCYFWPTMLGVTSERVPKGGALAMALLGGWGMAVVGIVTAPLMGWIVDIYGHDELPFPATSACVSTAFVELPKVKLLEGDETVKGIDEAIELVTEVNADILKNQELPRGTTSKALREIARCLPESATGIKAKELIDAADAYGGPYSFRWISTASIFLVIIFGGMYIQDKRKGGYQVEKIN